jgi:hypothetical protein
MPLFPGQATPLAGESGSDLVHSGHDAFCTQCCRVAGAVIDAGLRLGDVEWLD